MYHRFVNDLLDAHQMYELVRAALARMNDLNALKDHGITTLLGHYLPQSDQLPGLRTRSFLLSLIEQMRPSSDMANTASEWRQYQILKQRYELHRPLIEIALGLSLSERQLRREHQRALHGLAALAYTQLRQLATQTPARSTGDASAALYEAVQRLQAAPCVFDLAPLLQDVLGIVAQSWGGARTAQRLPIELRLAETSRLVYTDRGILHQLLLKLCQLYLRDGRAHASAVLSIQTGDTSVTVRIEPSHSSAIGESADAQFCRWLAESLPTALVLHDDHAEFELPVKEQARRVFIIDDEAAMINLYKDYLVNLNYEVLTETKPEQALQRAVQLCPDVIVLDVMMPAMDGWELLQRLRHTPALGDVPILACSVLDDAVLAHALGATRFMKKPILRQQFIRALDELSRQPRQ